MLTTATMTAAPGISAAGLHALEEGARGFFERQGLDVLADFLRREGGDTLAGEFAGLAEPALREEPGRRAHCMKCPDGCIHAWI